MKRYRTFIKQHELVIQECNKGEGEINGKSWYCFVIQHKDENVNNICVGSMKLFRYMVSGYVYWFPNKSNRDSMFKWLSRKKN
jgi:hypothetical protein